MTEQIEFTRTVEGLFVKGVEPELNGLLKEKLKAAGLDLDRTLLPGYPAALVHQWIEVAAKVLYADQPLEEGLRQMGHRTIPAMEDNLIGRALTAGLKLLGPRRTLERMQRIFRNNNNYQEVTVTPLGPNSLRITIGFGFGVPTFYQGIFEQGLRLIGAEEISVKVIPSPPPTALLDISWKA